MGIYLSPFEVHIKICPNLAVLNACVKLPFAHTNEHVNGTNQTSLYVQTSDTLSRYRHKVFTTVFASQAKLIGGATN